MGTAANTPAKYTLKLELEFDITDPETVDYLNLTQVNSENVPWLFADLEYAFADIGIRLTSVKKID